MEANQYSFLNLKVLLQKFCLFWLILGNLHVHVGITLTYSKHHKVKVKSAYEPMVAHQAGAYPSFYCMKQLGVFLLPPGWDASQSQGYPQH